MADTPVFLYVAVYDEIADGDRARRDEDRGVARADAARSTLSGWDL
jgi:hypothetical protein